MAHDLNRENVLPPRGRLWNASTINGNAERGAGLIFNELYAGRIVWNKVRMVKDPDTGKRLSRPNPRDEWQSIEAPQLRIVEQSVWEQAHALKTEKSHLASHVKRRAPHLLSGLLRCGCCGSGMSVHDRDKTGKTQDSLFGGSRERELFESKDHLPARHRKTCAQRHGGRTERPAADRDLCPQLQQ
ncbi:recombinase family protein [Bradyrhizobium sp. BR 1433]|uniref:recombinase family protein n=1 Tax=Bradyrhizobium sp. BR 1433 TaxID=3447967 RepID=UPI003EE4CA1E